jgi:hypothetical protein
MLNRWIQPVCIGLALLGGGLSASIALAQTNTERAVQSYVNVTLPAIARMKPYIDKSASRPRQGVRHDGPHRYHVRRLRDRIYNRP